MEEQRSPAITFHLTVLRTPGTVRTMSASRRRFDRGVMGERYGSGRWQARTNSLSMRNLFYAMKPKIPGMVCLKAKVRFSLVAFGLSTITNRALVNEIAHIKQGRAWPLLGS
jgi:hypothetical protein